MNGFLKRVRRLKKMLKKNAPSVVTLIYEDGSERTMDSMKAFMEIMSAPVVDIRYPNSEEAEDGFFEALLGCCHNAGDLWADGDDSWMLPEEK